MNTYKLTIEIDKLTKKDYARLKNLVIGVLEKDAAEQMNLQQESVSGSAINSNNSLYFEDCRNYKCVYNVANNCKCSHIGSTCQSHYR